MKKTVFSLVCAFVVAFGAMSASRAAAASTDPAVVSIPFSFVVGQQLLPAGTYRITTMGDDASSLMIQNVAGKAGAFAVVSERVANPNPQQSDAQVLFKVYAGQHFLWRVTTPGDARQLILRERQMDQTLARLNLLPPEHVNGVSK